MNDITEYTLNFVIPQGPTGPKGSSLPGSICCINFSSADTSKVMSIENSQIYPSNSPNYQVNSNSIIILTPGNYEMSICGKIDQSTNVGITVELEQEENGTYTRIPGMYGTWKDGTQMVHFSQTTVCTFTKATTLRVRITTTANGNINITFVNLIIKKIDFSSEVSK